MKNFKLWKYFEGFPEMKAGVRDAYFEKVRPGVQSNYDMICMQGELFDRMELREREMKKREREGVKIIDNHICLHADDQCASQQEQWVRRSYFREINVLQSPLNVKEKQRFLV